MTIDISQMPNVDKEEVFKYMRKIGWVESRVYWLINSRYRTYSELKTWIKFQLENPGPELKKVAAQMTFIKNEDKRMQEIIRYWNVKLTYKADDGEEWANAEDTIKTLKGDCEDGAALVFLTARLSGISENRIFFVCGHVRDPNLRPVDVGHAYCVYIANNLKEYVADWTYYPVESIAMKVPYDRRNEYNYGKTEWFRFTDKDSFRKKQ